MDWCLVPSQQDICHAMRIIQMVRNHAPEMQPIIIISNADPLDVRFVCHAKLIGTDGRNMDFSVTEDTAEMLMVELTYHLKALRRKIADAPKIRDLSEDI